MNFIGAMLIFAGCTAAGIMKARSLGELDRCYTSLISAFTLLKSEICSRAEALDAALRICSGAASGDAEKFLQAVEAGFACLGEKSFRDIWSGAADSCLGGMPVRPLSAVKAIGGSLGRYDAAMQCTSLERCINDIAAEQKALRETLNENKRMCVGIGGAAGLIIAIVLI